LLGQQIRYVGLDYAMPLVQLGRATYAGVPFLNGDATRLPFADACWDVVISGCVLLHVPDWQAAVAETVRVAKEWCIFHRTPVSNDPTTLMTKLAYGVRVIEWLFNESEFVELIHSHGCELTSALPIATRARIEGVTDTLALVTYLFRKEPPGPARTASPST
jgi:ubiquinone/menaquinone biosynthesis C-methylase UbiE